MRCAFIPYKSWWKVDILHMCHGDVQLFCIDATLYWNETACVSLIQEWPWALCVISSQSTYLSSVFCPLAASGSLYQGRILVAWDNLGSHGIMRKSINPKKVIPTICATVVAGVAFQCSFFRPQTHAAVVRVEWTCLTRVATCHAQLLLHDAQVLARASEVEMSLQLAMT